MHHSSVRGASWGLQLHHVRDIPFHVPIYDWVFLAIGGIGLILLGIVLMVPSRTVSATRA